ncbi:hypothetical protein J6590_050134 [Homalodisca vitripennis]|nr:hypothetical protein J6590_050134 [Homalodisca vitripennis]
MWSRIKCLRLNDLNDPGCSRGRNLDNLTSPVDLDLLPLDDFLQQKYQAGSEENMTFSQYFNFSETLVN